MRAHKTLTREDVVRHGPVKVASMVASEFLRAADAPDLRADVMACYERARELMGVLETMPLDDSVAEFLAPIYRRCTRQVLMQEERLHPEIVKATCYHMAEAFEEAARMMQSGGESDHA